MFQLVLRIGFSLAIVLGMMWALARLVRRPLTGGRGAATLTVLARAQVGRNSAVTVVRVADRALVLGVTDNQVSLLAETDPAAFEQPPPRRAAVVLDTVPQPGVSQPVVPHPGVPHPGLSQPVVGVGGRLDGSLLSARTWRAALDFLRERTARR